MLAFEILLTRVCALRVAFHFSFLVISNALLGLGAAGTALVLVRRRIAGREEAWLARATWAFALSVPLAYAFLVTWPVPAQVLVRDPGDLGSFAVFGLGAAVPFFFAGVTIGLILSVHARAVHALYGLDLVGAGAGCLLCPALLWSAGAGGAAAAITLLALLAAVPCGSLRGVRRRLVRSLPAVAGLAALIPFADEALPVPSKTRLQITSSVTITPADLDVYSRWSAISRVDLVTIPADQRTMFMKGSNASDVHPEEQCFLLQDGSAGTFVHDFSGSPEGLRELEKTLYFAATAIHRPESVFVIGAGGGPDMWAAVHGGATRVRGVELNEQIVDVHRAVLGDWSRDLLERPGVELLHGEGRHALMVEPERWDVVQMSGIDTWTALVSGAYMLAENYLYTEEAVRDMFAVLEPDGVLQITRFSGEVEALRLLATVERAHRRLGAGPFAECVVSLRARAFSSVVCKRVPFDAEELRRLDEFVARAGIDVDHHPRRTLGGVVEQFVRSQHKEELIRAARADIEPVSDDSPYFFNFYRWDDLAGAGERIDFGETVTQGNPAFLLAQLGLSTLAGLLLIVLPLAATRRKRGAGGGGRRVLAATVYFACVGFGFIALEVSLMQKLVLLLGHPLYSITVSLFGMLVFTGMAVLWSERWFDRPTARLWLVPGALTLCMTVFALLAADLVRAAAPLPLLGRAALALAVLAPVAAAVGIPFAHGIRLLERRAPELVPWAWATNAAATVVGSIAAVIVSMNFGFRAVFVLGVAAYWIACVAAVRLGRGGTDRPPVS